MRVHGTEDDARRSFAEEFDGLGHRWLAVLFEPTKAGVRCTRTSWNFPVDELRAAVRELEKLLSAEEQRLSAPKPERGPLPLAPFVKEEAADD